MPRLRPTSPRLVPVVLALLVIAGLPARAAELVLAPRILTEEKAVFGVVESLNRVEARARIGGTVTDLRVTEGSAVKAGEVVARVEDEKLEIRRTAVEAGIRAAEAELANAQADLARAEQLSTGIISQARLDQLRTAVNVFTSRRNSLMAERAVIQQQMAEGAVLAPEGGRVLRAPLTKGSVILPGESVASIATDGYILRVAVPERHAVTLQAGAGVRVGPRGLDPSAGGGREGRIAKLYPEMSNGRVVLDVAVEGLGDYFVGERALVFLPVAKREALVVPAAAISRRHGLDYVRIAGPAGTPVEVVVEAGERVRAADGEGVEILSGLKAGDRVILP